MRSLAVWGVWNSAGESTFIWRPDDFSAGSHLWDCLSVLHSVQLNGRFVMSHVGAQFFNAYQPLWVLPVSLEVTSLWCTHCCFSPSLQTILPAAAQDVYYRDEIGNISTSHLLVLDDSVEMEIRPRFPLFGGWKTHYIIGYNLPSYEYLYNLGRWLRGRE